MDQFNHAIRKITSGGVVTTIGGAPANTAIADGADTSASFASPRCIARGPKGQIYVGDAAPSGLARLTRGVDVSGAIGLTSPTNAQLTGGTLPFTVTYTLPSAAQAGSVKLYFDSGSGHVYRLSLADSNATAGTHSFTLNTRDLTPAVLGNITAIDHPVSTTTMASGRYSVTLEYNDNATGNFVFTVPTLGVVVDLDGPYFAYNYVDLEATSSAGAVATFDETVADALSGVQAGTVSFKVNGTTVHSGDTFPIAGTTVDGTATDNVGNVGTTQFYITVHDYTKPTASVPATITATPGANGYAQVGDLTGQVTAQDIVTATANLTILQDLNQYVSLPVGSYPIKFTVRDEAFNSIDVTSTVAVAFPAVTTPALGASKAAGPVVKTVPLGAAVPGAGANGIPAGATFGAFFTPAIADTRVLVARATVLDGKKKIPAIYQEDSGGTGSVVAIAGGKVDPANANSTVVWQSFLDPLIAPANGIAFVAKVADASVKKTEDEGLWTNVLPSYYEGAPLTRVLQEGHDVGIGAGITLKSIVSASVRKEEIISLVKLSGAVTPKDNVALIRQSLDAGSGMVATASLLRTGDSPAGLGAKVLGISAFMPAPGSTGQGRTHADKGIAARVKTDMKGDVLVLIADDGTVRALLSTVGVDAFLNAQATKLSLPGAAGNGVAAKITAKFPPATKATDAIVFSKTIAPFTHSLAVGAMIPGGGATFTKLSDPAANDTPGCVFLATISTKQAALYEWASDYTQREIVRSGASATDADGNALGGTVTWKSFKNYALPDGSGVVFVADLTGKDAAGRALTAANKLGLWAEDASHKIRLLLRAGQDVVVGGATKKLASFKLLDALPGSFGSRRSYNAAKSVVVLATFTDKSQALVRADVP